MIFIRTTRYVQILKEDRQDELKIMVHFLRYIKIIFNFHPIWYS
jgi:hypothetical protein